MNAGKIALAILLAAGAAAGYWYFPNPLEDAAAETQRAAPSDAEAAKPSEPPEAA